MKLREALTSRTLVCDGGMGTQLVARGLRAGDVPELWNVDRPQDVSDIHRAYADAGCDLVTTNSFGASSIALARHTLESRMRELNLAAARLARNAVPASVYVLGDIGPCTQMIEPYGDTTEDAALESFHLQAKALLEGGVDGFVIETMSDVNEMMLAIRGVRQASTELPIFATYAFNLAPDGSFRTMMGTTAMDAVCSAISAGADAVGANCGTALSLSDYADLGCDLITASGKTPVIVQPNAGSPHMVDGKHTYDASPMAMAGLANELKDEGVRIIGGCCGTTPAHLAAIARIIKST